MDLLDLIERNLTDEDLAIYQCLIYPNDNRNLLHQIFHEYHQLEPPDYKWPAVIPEEMMRNYRRNYSFLPDYMQQFLLDNSGVFGSFTLTDIELKLRGYFYDFINRQQSDFLTLFYEWQYRLEQTVAEFNQGQVDFLSGGESQDLDNLNPMTVQTVALDRKELLSELDPLVERGKYASIEKLIDTYYWEFGEYWTDTFSSNAVFSYTIRLLRMVRWQQATTDIDLNRKDFLTVVEKVKDGLNELNFLKS